MPLGDSWSGICLAAPAAERPPDPNTVQQLCNFGYARGKCPHVPADSADAVRFGISHDREGIVRVYWVVEKDHLPFAHGPLDYSRTDAGFATTHPDSCVSQQAQAFVSSYLRRKGDPARP